MGGIREFIRVGGLVNTDCYSLLPDFAISVAAENKRETTVLLFSVSGRVRVRRARDMAVRK